MLLSNNILEKLKNEKLEMENQELQKKCAKQTKSFYTTE